MSLKKTISTDHIQSMKDRDQIKKTILSVVKGEIQTIEKNTNQSDLSDPEVQKIITKMIKSLNETILQSNDEESKLQLEVLSKYMPSQMGRDQIRSKINQLIKDNGGTISIGEVMKSFANDPVDRKLVSQVFNEG